MNIRNYCIGLAVVVAIGGGSYMVVKKLNNNSIPQAPTTVSTASSEEILNVYDQKIAKELENKGHILIIQYVQVVTHIT